MLKLFDKQDRSVSLGSNPSYVLDLSRLKPGEFLEFRYDAYQRLSSVRKLECLSFGETARAETDIKPGELGQVRWNGSLWRARCEGENAIVRGQTVFVHVREGLTLFVIAA